MATDIPINGQLAAALGLARQDLANKEQEGRLDARRYFELTAIETVARSHPGLWLDRFLPFDRTDGKGWEFNGEWKGPLLRKFAGLANKFYEDTNSPWRRWSRYHRELYPEGDAAVLRSTIKPGWRWIIGLGNNTVLETGITLHHTYAVPYVPGSALKGLTQALCERGQEPPELTAQLGRVGSPERRERTDAIFGTQKRDNEPEPDPEKRKAGEIVFVGAVPNAADRGSSPRLAVDVMTPHFPAYYQDSRGQREPLEIEDPNPVPFLVVAGGSYDLTLAARVRGRTQWLPLAMSLCIAALDELGIGGKTGKGYGYFSEV